MATLTVGLTLFFAGMLTIFLPCILPLVPIVVGVSVAGQSKWRPLLTVIGMVVSFVVFNFLVFLLLNAAPGVANIIRLGTFYVLLLFGAGFLFHELRVQLAVAVLGSALLFAPDLTGIIGFAIFGCIAMYFGGTVASRLQQLGATIQTDARSTFGAEHPLTALFIGLTLGLVWVPCAGPALGFALALVRDEPGVRAFLLLLTYGLGASVPLLIVGYGGQYAVKSVRSLTKYTGLIKEIAGVILILTAFGLRYDLITKFQTAVADATGYGRFAENLEKRLFDTSSSNTPTPFMNTPVLPVLSRAPEFDSTGPWHNSDALTMAGLKGKVVLVDFWTYSCINCIRTLPYIQGYWDKYKNTGKFVVVGVHAPEFVFEQDVDNVKAAIKKYNLTYPIVQDNTFGTWNQFANRYWPAKYLIDAQGNIRYEHFGEGGYDETNDAIMSLLKEIDANTPIPPGNIIEPTAGRYPRSPETYVGERSWPAFFNAQGDPTDAAITYAAPEKLPLNRFGLGGTWQLKDNGEYQELQSETGEIRMHFQGGEINLVLGTAASPVDAEVFIDGKSVKTFTVNAHDLYQLFTGTPGDHELILKFKGKGLEAYAFTFG